MNKFIFLFFIGLFLSNPPSLFGQDNKLYVGELSLDEIEGPWIVMRINWRLKERNAIILYGQACIRGIGAVYNEEELKRCVGLKYANGELVKITHYTEALNIMERNGFTLSIISPEGEFENEYTRFIFRRGEHEPVLIDRKRIKP